jgi:dihydrofolate reductase
MTRRINAIVAVDDQWGIGKDGTMPWPHLAEDLKRFKQLTDGAMIVMGKNTWLSLPKRPLPNRDNIVVSRTLDDDFAIKVSGDPKAIITKLKQATDEDIWIIGGAEIYRQFLPFCNSVYITRIHGDYQCDTRFPEAILDRHFVIDYIESSIVDNEVEIHYEIWEKDDVLN